MAYLTATTRPALIAGGITSRATPTPNDGSAALVAPKQPALWIMSGTEALATVDTAGYISDARDLGIQKGDLLFYVKTDAAPISVQIYIVVGINATTGAADLSDGTAIVATNSD